MESCTSARQLISVGVSRSTRPPKCLRPLLDYRYGSNTTRRAAPKPLRVCGRNTTRRRACFPHFPMLSYTNAYRVTLSPHAAARRTGRETCVEGDDRTLARAVFAAGAMSGCGVWGVGRSRGCGAQACSRAAWMCRRNVLRSIGGGAERRWWAVRRRRHLRMARSTACGVSDCCIICRMMRRGGRWRKCSASPVRAAAR